MAEYEYQTTERDADHTTDTPTNPVKPSGDGWRMAAAASYNHDAGGGVIVPRIQWYWERALPEPQPAAQAQAPAAPNTPTPAIIINQ